MTADDERQSRLAATAGRLAFFPARVAARASRDQLASTPDDVLVPELARLIDRAFATSLPEEIVQAAVRHQVVDRVVAELVASGALDRAVKDALASPHTAELTDAVARSDPMRRAIREEPRLHGRRRGLPRSWSAAFGRAPSSWTIASSRPCDAGLAPPRPRSPERQLGRWRWASTQP
jgi:soluble lytic murein transglycosylase-like protein